MDKKSGLLALVWVLVCGVALLAQTGADVRYVYDEKGRLIGSIDENNNATAYRYDGVGNLVAIERLTPGGAVDIFFVEPNRGRTGTAPGSGTPVTIHGIGFSAVAADNQVTFNGVSAVVETAAATAIKTKVPAGATTGRVRVMSPLGAAVSRSDFTVLSISVMVSPASVSVRTGERQQFTATLVEGGATITPDVVWSLSPTVGAIDRNGLYTAPARAPLGRAVTVIATSTEESTARASATVTIAASGIGPIFTPGLSYGVARPEPLPIGPIFTPGLSYGVARPEQLPIGPIFTPGLSYGVARPEPLPIGPIFTPGLSYGVARPALLTLAPIFNPGTSYTTVAIAGLDPNRALRGATNVSLTIMGNHFDGATALEFLLPGGAVDRNITVTNLTVNPSGTQITATISVASAAALGARTVVVRARAGPSTTRVTSSNQFMIDVSE